MKKLLITTFVLIFSSYYFCQYNFQVSSIIMPQGFSVNTLNGFGSSNLLNNTANISFMNPAAMNSFTNFSVGVSYQNENKIKSGWIADIGGHRMNLYFPKSAGLVVPFNNLRFGFSLGQLYNWQMDFGKVLKTTIENPDETQLQNKPIIRTKVYSYSFTTSFTVEKIFAKDNLCVGFRYNKNRLYDYEDLLDSGLEGITYANNFSIGTCYRYYYENNKYLETGFLYESPIEFDEIIQLNHKNIVDVIPADNSTGNYPTQMTTYYEISEVRLKGRVPGKISFDYIIYPFENMKILGTINYLLRNSSFTINYKDQFEAGGSFLYLINPEITTSFGYYTTALKLKEDYFGINNKLDALFLTGGLIFKYRLIIIDLSLADSHLFSGNGWKQTVGKFSLGLQL